jgi:hypothetical protein
LIPAKPIHLEIDASGFTTAGIITQQHNKGCGGAEGVTYSAKGNKSYGKGYWHQVAY